MILKEVLGLPTKAALEAVRGNNSDFEVSLGNWVQGGNATLARQEINPRSGEGHMRQTATNSGVNVFAVTPSGASALAALPSTPYRLELWYRPTIARRFQVNIRWYTSGGTEISLVGGHAVNAVDQTAEEYQLYTWDRTSPSNAARMRLDVFFVSGAVGDVFDYDDITLTVLGQPGDTYFDLITNKPHTWDGTEWRPW